MTFDLYLSLAIAALLVWQCRQSREHLRVARGVRQLLARAIIERAKLVDSRAPGGALGPTQRPESPRPVVAEARTKLRGKAWASKPHSPAGSAIVANPNGNLVVAVPRLAAPTEAYEPTHSSNPRID